ncbi:MAG: hypothetical protein KDD72_14215, partial [Anaerolineales bacterium]|nr:hypothetical protein [Anaerolineales bacterium]
MIEQLNDGLHHRLTLVSAPVGFGKTTLVSGWVNRLRLEDSGNVQGIAWLSLDENDNEPVRFLTYFIHALKQVCAKNVDMGKSPLAMLHSPQPPSLENVLTSLINELVEVSGEIVFVLDDYHVIETPAIDDTLGFLLDHLPSNLHLVITSRADPSLPLPRLRARGQVVELRSADLRFTFEETVEFFHHISGLELSSTEIAALENRTEGWIAGLKLAALSMQGREDISRFIETFTGSHRYIVDYLVEEVLLRQTEVIQYFLLCTSILDRLCGPLCDAVLQNPSVSSQETLEYLEQTNLFLVPLDNERHWYRYHHLFADLLRHRLQRDVSHSAGKDVDLTALHIRASQWYEENDMAVEAFQHATLASDIERAERIMDGDGMPLQYRGAALPVMQW